MKPNTSYTPYLEPCERGKVYILILNWNGWKDTIECLESVFRNNYINYQVIVCDNNSTDRSLEYMKAWAEGLLDAWVSPKNSLRHLSFPPIEKPINYIEYNKEEAERGGSKTDVAVPLIFIQTGKNLGFAGGNNVGLRYAIARNDFDYVWLLNNDTVIDPDALNQMVNTMEENPGAGICGSTLLFYDTPEKIQALGGAKYNKWLGLPKHLGGFEDFNKPINRNHIISLIDYVIGASMLVSNSFVKNVGLLNEEYFLYFEEIDWAVRASGKYYLTYTDSSIIYHKEGQSIQGGSGTKAKSLTADYHGIKNRLVFTKKYYKEAIITVYLGLVWTMLNRARRGQWNRILMILKICTHSLWQKLGKIKF